MSGFWSKIRAEAGLINQPVPQTLVESAPDVRVRFVAVPVVEVRHDARDLIETRGRPRLYATNADRQRAYRERNKENK